jgi:hypothetical protein
MPRLFAVMLGGRAPRANTELHDVVFVTGERIEDTYPQLRDRWFGSQDGLHIDSWWALDVVDGHRLELAGSAAASPSTLFFVNLGAYRPGLFCELHAAGFYVARRKLDAKRRAKAELLGGTEQLHVDDLHAVDDCLAIDRVSGLHVVLTRTEDAPTAGPHNGYHPLPR